MERKELFYFLMSVPVIFVSVLVYGMVLLRNRRKSRRRFRFQLTVFVFCVNMLYLLLFHVLAVYCVYSVFYPLGLLMELLTMVVILTGLAFRFCSKVINETLPAEEDRKKQADQVEAEEAEEKGMEERIEKILTDLFEKQCIYRKPGLTITEVARLAGTNRTYISLVIHKKFNTHFGVFVNRYRICEAAALMRSTRQSISEIAEVVGFNSISAFNSSFREVYGQSPTGWRKQLGKTINN